MHPFLTDIGRMTMPSLTVCLAWFERAYIGEWK
jgi:hypothetical protein